MRKEECKQCGSIDLVTVNETNYSHLFYCHGCDRPFNPSEWPCPRCGETSAVSRNPFDDQCEYYCYRDDMAFNRLGPTFHSTDLEYDTLDEGFEVASKQLSLQDEKRSESARTRLEFRLENTGEEPVEVQGTQPIAVQQRLTDDTWWTIHGNPEKYVPDERVVLDQGEQLTWDVVVAEKGMRGPGLNLNQYFHSGEYRFVYWGIPSSETVVAVLRDIEFMWR